jgi:hypothetical protein
MLTRTLLLAMVVLAECAHANSDWAKDRHDSWARDWRKLGSTTASFSRDRDEIRCASKGFVRQIVFEVRNTAVNFNDVDVYLANGTKMDVQLRSVVRAGQRSRVIDLPGEARVISKILFRYRSVDAGGKGKAEVVVWGKKL